MTKTAVVYGCGGAGINIAAHYLGAAIDDNFTTFRPVALDTSRSNLAGHNYSEDQIYIIPNPDNKRDGAGALRSLAIGVVRTHIEPIVTKHQPGDLNIVIFNGGGGTGSSIGPLLAARLIAEGHDVICLMLECGHNKVHMVNTRQTLKSLYGVAARNESNMAVVLVPLAAQTKQNKEAWNTISSLSMLWSGNNEALDGADLHNFLHHQVHTGIKGTINLLSVYTSPEEVMRVKQPIAVASIYRDRQMDQVHPNCIYHTHGFNKLEGYATDQYHFVLSEAELIPFVDRINAGVKAIEDSLKSEAKPDLKLGVDDADDDGMCY